MYHNSLVYATTLSKSQILMRWGLIIEYFGTNIQHISVVGNIVADTLSRIPYTSVNMYEPITIKAQCLAKTLFATGRVESIEDCFPQDIFNVQR